MKKVIITFLILYLFCFFYLNEVLAANIYVDAFLGSNCTSGSYSVSSRNCRGSDGNAYNTVQEAVNVVKAGDTIYMRGGTYAEHVSMASAASGTAGNVITLRSYPGEWAKLDPGHDRGSDYNAYVIYYRSGGHSSCVKYWTFSNFEVTGGGTSNSGANGGGIIFDTGTHLTFEYLYIHENYAGNSNNPAGIALFSEDSDAPQYCIIRYCVLVDNTCSSDNCANVNIMTSYRQNPGSTQISEVVSHNEVYYNYIEGSHNGIKYKGPNECITLDNTGANMTYKKYGDKIHHNIITNFADEGLVARQDFIQVYNNIFDSNGPQLGISFGSAHNDPEREPFHAVSYNNLTIGCDQTIRHENNSVYGGELTPYIHWYNNIFESVGSGHEGYDMNVFPYDPASNSVEMDTVTAENNLYVPRSASENIIEADNSYYSGNSFKSGGYSSVLYTSTSSSGLHKTGSDYKCNSFFSVGGGKTIGDGGLGRSHPYLGGVVLPSYIGAADPSDDDWVDGVLGLGTLTGGVPTNLRDGSGDPSWIENYSGDSSHLVAPAKLRIIAVDD